MSKSIICHDESDLHYFSAHDLKLQRVEKLPKEFFYKKGYDHCKDCQIDWKLYAIGDDRGTVFLIPCDGDVNNKVIEKLEGVHQKDKSIFCLDAKEIGGVKYLVSAGEGGKWCLWNIDERKFLGRGSQEKSSETDAFFVAKIIIDKNNIIASGNEDCTLRFHDFSTMKNIKKFEDHEHWVYDIVHVRTRNTLITCSYDGFMHLYDLKTQEKCETIELEKIIKGETDFSIICMLYLDEKNMLISGDYGGSIYAQDLRKTNEVLYKRTGVHSDWIRKLSRSSTSEAFVTSSDDNFVKMFNTNDGRELNGAKLKDMIFGAFYFDSTIGKDMEQTLEDMNERVSFLSEPSELEDSNLIKIDVGNLKLEAFKFLLA